MQLILLVFTNSSLIMLACIDNETSTDDNAINEESISTEDKDFNTDVNHEEFESVSAKKMMH